MPTPKGWTNKKAKRHRNRKGPRMVTVRKPDGTVEAMHPRDERFKGGQRITKRRARKKRREARFKALHESYRSDHWRAVREQAFVRDDGCCTHCGKAEAPLHCHHIHYNRLGEELLEDVRMLCVPCHEERHGRKLAA
jgi:5-methylcytosine-specific restriction endonuclease McrA